MQNSTLNSPNIQVPQDEDTFAEDFMALLDEYDYERPHRGQILEGQILRIDDHEILVDVGLKHTAIVPRQDIERLNASTVDDLHAGQDIMVYVLQPNNRDGDLIVSINKALEQTDWIEAVKMMEADEAFKGKVIGYNKGGMLVEFGRLQGFIPQSHLVSLEHGLPIREAKDNLVGDEIHVKVIEVERERNRLILSERQARHAARLDRMLELQVHDVITGHVIKLVDFGAFVDLGGGVDGLIHISKLGHTYIDHPREILEVGQEVEVLIDGIDLERGRISLNRRAILPDPWDAELTGETPLQEGDLVSGTVVGETDFGVFVILTNGMKGLVHKSEMTLYPTDQLHKGIDVLMRVDNIDYGEKKVGLSLDKVTVDEQQEWIEARTSEDVVDQPVAVDEEPDEEPDMVDTDPIDEVIAD